MCVGVCVCLGVLVGVEVDATAVLDVYICIYMHTHRWLDRKIER